MADRCFMQGKPKSVLLLYESHWCEENNLLFEPNGKVWKDVGKLVRLCWYDPLAQQPFGRFECSFIFVLSFPIWKTPRACVRTKGRRGWGFPSDLGKTLSSPSQHKSVGYEFSDGTVHCRALSPRSIVKSREGIFEWQEEVFYVRVRQGITKWTRARLRKGLRGRFQAESFVFVKKPGFDFLSGRERKIENLFPIHKFYAHTNTLARFLCCRKRRTGGKVVCFHLVGRQIKPNHNDTGHVSTRCVVIIIIQRQQV